MNERKSRFAAPSALPEDPALRVLSMRSKSEPRDASPPLTVPGRLAAQDQEGLVGRLKLAREETAAINERLDKELAARETERKEGLLLLRLDPESIAVTEYANRHKLSLSSDDEGFQSLKASIKANGQDIPVGVRPAPAGSAKPYELVAGHRRLEAIRQLNQEGSEGFLILARIDAKASEAKDLVLKMYRENADRQDLSAYETGTMFAQWLDTGICSTQRELAALAGLKENTVSQYLSVAQLPAEVCAAFGDVRAIAMRWGSSLASAVKAHPSQVIARARQIAKADPKPEPQAVYEALIAAAPTRRKSVRTEKVSDTVKVNDKVLFRIALKDGRLTIKPRQVGPDKLQQFYDDLKGFANKWLSSHGGEE